ncbi:3-keto-disaccharide hydrolase [Roseibacillus ishigakijimensis]|nr:DUF1080 domain-containing protein [Roseibacillus ishigakijimensis]
MKKSITSVVGFSLLSLTAQSESLLEGDLSSWQMAGPGKFEVNDGIATAQGGMGLWWYSKESYRNATISLEFKLEKPTYNSGVFVRFPDPGNDPWVAVRQGYEIQVSGRDVNKHSTGAVYDIQAPVANTLKEDGEWNKMEIHTVGDLIAVVVNGTLTNLFHAEKGRGDEEGYFGIQNHDDGSPAQFRNIEIRELDDHVRLHTLLPDDAELAYELAKNPDKKEAWHDKADFGPAFIQTYGDYFQGEYRSDAALKGMLIQPDPEQDNLVALFNLETLQLVTATHRGVSLDNTPFGGAHGTQNKIQNQGNPYFNNATGAGWADPAGSFADSRKHPGHGNFAHLQFNGYHRHGHDIILDYTVNGTPIKEQVVVTGQGDIRRILEIAGHEAPLSLRVSTTAAPEAASENGPLKMTAGEEGVVWEIANREPLVLGIDYLADGSIVPVFDLASPAEKATAGEGLYPETFEVTPQIDESDDALLVDQIPLPPMLEDSPYKNKVRLSDLDFFSDGDRAALCTWDGDVWLLSGLKEFQTLTWKRFASGLFEPLGLKIIDDVIHLNARDGIWQVKDLNGDNEADRFEVFNNDVLITDNFHEFTFGLETDAEGNFYFAKAATVRPGGRNFEKILDHNGSFMKLSPDGEELTVVATGLRAPGGIGVGPNGELTTGENEGTWQPCCKLNYFTPEQQPVFLGVEQARHGVTKDFHEPLCYFPMNVDNSGGAQIWVPDFAKIGLAQGELLHLSYGQSTIYRVLPQEVEGQMQGGVIALPAKLSSSAQRAVFHPDGSLFVCGMRGWQTNAANEAGVQRIRHNEEVALKLPEAMSVEGDKLTIRFDVELDEELATDPESFAIQRWKYIRGPQYGSGEFSIDNPDKEAEENALKQESKGHKEHDEVEVSEVALGDDGRTLILTIPSLKPAQQMEIAYDLESTEGDILIGTIYSTIHKH